MQDQTSFADLVEIMARLRAADGCPWDREQTHATLKPYLLEEAYEVLEAIDRQEDEELCKELGDVLLQVVFHAQVAREEDRFSIDEVCRAIVEKLVRRHPHVFGDVQVDGAREVVANWERIKQDERQDQAAPASVLDGVPKHLPALLRAQRIQTRAARVGFDWDHIAGPLDKVEEEFGDLLFALVNTGRFLELCPEDALRRAVIKFERRFRAVETLFREQGKDLEEASLEEMDRVWDQVKQAESPGGKTL